MPQRAGYYSLMLELSGEGILKASINRCKLLTSWVENEPQDENSTRDALRPRHFGSTATLRVPKYGTRTISPGALRLRVQTLG